VSVGFGVQSSLFRFLSYESFVRLRRHFNFAGEPTFILITSTGKELPLQVKQKGTAAIPIFTTEASVTTLQALAIVLQASVIVFAALINMFGALVDVLRTALKCDVRSDNQD
jgi:hypothetical protein